MKRSHPIPLLVAIAALLTLGASTSSGKVTLEKYDGGFFSIERPQGWDMFTAGACAQFSFLLRDPHQPLRQIFFFGEVGPVYMSEMQKQIDYQYMSMGGYPVQWIEMPVVDPLTPGNFLSNWHLIARTNIAQMFMPQCPKLESLQIVSTTTRPSLIGAGNTELIRALFTEGSGLGEGLFLVTVISLLPSTGSPGGGLAYGFLITGITAPQSEFREIEADLARSLESVTISESYVQNCLAQQQSQYAGLLKAGKTLSEASDIITDGWESRNRTYDIVSEKMSDAIIGRERLYDPDTGNVYEFEVGFYDQYITKQDTYEMNNLTPLPDDDHGLWMAPALDGYKHVR